MSTYLNVLPHPGWSQGNMPGFRFTMVEFLVREAGGRRWENGRRWEDRGVLPSQGLPCLLRSLNRPARSLKLSITKVIVDSFGRRNR